MSARTIKVGEGRNMRQGINRHLGAVILLIMSVLTPSWSFTGRPNHPMETALSVRADESLTSLALEWNRTYGGIGSDFALSLVSAADGGYALAGRTYSFGAGSSDIWLVKTDENGNHLWSKTYGGTNVDGAFAFVQTVDGGYALAGHTNSFGAGNYDFWLVKTDSTGNMVWNRTYGGTNEDWAYALIQTADEGYALIGETWSFGAGNSDVWLIRTDAFGNHLWNRTYGGTNVDGAFAFVQTVDGGYALAGHTNSFGAGNTDAWLVKIDALGNHEWNKTCGGMNEDYACRLIPTGDDGYVLAGSTQSFGAGGDDFWLVKTARGASTIIVPDDYSTIQEAINNAADGDTVFVKAGTYYEHVVVNKSVSLVGENATTTIVDGSGTGNVFTIYENSVKITGFKLQNSGAVLGNAGLRLDGASFCSISGNGIRDNFAGIWFEGSSENLVMTNDITSNTDDGIVFDYSHNNTVSGNHIALHGYFGIVINWSHNNTICYNNVTQTTGPSHGDGINLWQSGQNHIFHNQVVANNRYGICVEGQSNNNTVSHNCIVGNSHGIVVKSDSKYGTMSQNIICQNDRGIYIEDSTQNTICGNHFTDNGQQVYMSSAGLPNYWDSGYPLGGNCWSDYSGADLFSGPCQNESGSDGIGDTPYVIDANNTDSYPLIPTKLGDLDHDSAINILDAIILAKAFGSEPGDLNWNPDADINNDNKVNILDAIILANNFGKTM